MVYLGFKYSIHLQLLGDYNVRPCDPKKKTKTHIIIYIPVITIGNNKLLHSIITHKVNTIVILLIILCYCSINGNVMSYMFQFIFSNAAREIKLVLVVCEEVAALRDCLACECITECFHILTMLINNL